MPRTREMAGTSVSFGLHRHTLHSSIYFITFNTILPAALQRRERARQLQSLFLSRFPSTGSSLLPLSPPCSLTAQSRPQAHTSVARASSPEASWGRYTLTWKLLLKLSWFIPFGIVTGPADMSTACSWITGTWFCSNLGVLTSQQPGAAG